MSKQSVHQLADRQSWVTLDARYCAESVEPYLRMKGLNIEALPIRTHDHPDGATWAQLEAEYDAAQAAGVGDDI